MTIFVPTTKIFHSIHQNPCNRMESIEITANNNSATTTTMEGIVTIVPEKTFIDSTGTETLIKNQNKQENGNNQNDKGHQSKLGDASDNQGKNILAESLVETTILITNVIWCNFPLLPNVQVIPLRLYIQETLKRSRTSLSTLQTALLYLLRIKPKIGSIYLNLSSTSNSNLNSSSNSNSNPNIINIDSATCGRRMFLASLIVASKYLQDNNYSNNAWSKISGLSLKEINSIERRFLQLIVYNLYVSEEVFNNWTNLLNSHIKTILDNNDSPNDNNNNNNNNNKGNSDNNSNIDNKSNYSNDSNVNNNNNNNNNNFSNNNIDNNNSSNRGNQTVDNHKRNFFMINSSTTTISSKECEVKG